MHYYKYVIGNIIKCNKKLRVIGNQYNFNIIIVKFGLNLTNYAKKIIIWKLTLFVHVMSNAIQFRNQCDLICLIICHVT